MWLYIGNQNEANQKGKKGSGRVDRRLGQDLAHHPRQMQPGYAMEVRPFAPFNNTHALTRSAISWEGHGEI